MNQDRSRLFLFFALSLLIFWGTPILLQQLGLAPKPRPQANAPAQGKDQKKESAKADPKSDAKADDAKAASPDASNAAKTAASPAPALSKVKLVNADELVLGSVEPPSKNGGYLLQVRLSQGGAAVATVQSSQFHAERGYGEKAKTPLKLAESLSGVPPALALNLTKASGLIAQDPALNEETEVLGSDVSIRLDNRLWEVDVDADGRAVRAIENGQEATFRTTVNDLTIKKTYRLRKGTEGFELALSFQAAKDSGEIAYQLLAPYGMPIEGAWYATTFRDFFYAGAESGSTTTLVSLTAANVSSYYGKGKKSYQNGYKSRPLAFTGIENRYFATFLAPQHEYTETGRYDDTVNPLELKPARDGVSSHAEIGAEVLSRPISLLANQEVTQTYRIYAGPKTKDSLGAFGVAGSETLADFRNNYIPLAPFLARYVITPLLIQIHQLTQWLPALPNGNYGIAIIVLTCLIRLALFPLSRKQAIMAKKMQDLQPLMKEIQEKYNKTGNTAEISQEAKIQMQRDIWALYKRHDVSIFRTGCLLPLLQLPIMVGLWQALNNSVALRQSPFLYITDLAAPDQLFRFGFYFPFLGEYFNLLPFLVVGLMLFQMKLFTPPPATQEQKVQQDTMRFMMVIMSVMFYWVPSGLGIYFMTSSLWSIAERLFVNKLAKKHTIDLKKADKAAKETDSSKPKQKTWWDKLVEAAEHERTIRNQTQPNGEANGKALPSKDKREMDGGPGSGSGPYPKGKKRRDKRR